MMTETAYRTCGNEMESPLDLAHLFLQRLASIPVISCAVQYPLSCISIPFKSRSQYVNALDNRSRPCIESLQVVYVCRVCLSHRARFGRLSNTRTGGPSPAAQPALPWPDPILVHLNRNFPSAPPLVPHLRRTPYHTSVHHPRSLPRHFVRSFLSPRECAHDTLKGATSFLKPVLTAQGYPVNMAAAQLAIAKASLLASLLKADADADLASCSRDEIEQFHGLLNAAVAKCSPTNVQVWNTHATPF